MPTFCINFSYVGIRWLKRCSLTGINFGLVTMYATLYLISWIIFTIDLILIGGIPMGTNCAPLVADLFLYCHGRDFMTSLSYDNQVEIIEALNSTS